MRIRVIALLVSLQATVAAAQYIVTTSPAQVHRGDDVTVSISQPGVATMSAIAAPTVTLGGLDPIALVPAVSASPAAVNFTFDVPPTLPLGKYRPTVNIGGKPFPSTTPVKVTMAAAPKVTAARPTEWFPKGNDVTLTIFGDNFSPVAADNKLEFKGVKIFPLCKDNKKSDDCVRIKNADEHELTFENISFEKFAGRQTIVVHVGDQESNDSVSVLISKVPRSRPMTIALIVLFIILAIVISIVVAGRRKRAASPNAPSVLTSFFLDPQTSTYSLSTLQFYLWTGAAILGYAFLTAAQYLVQGKFALPEVPSGLPGILAISAGTTVIAAGVDSDKTKGGGKQKPSISDFLTTGAIVVPERVQFLVWTLIGVVAFVSLVFLSNPGTIEQLPQVPSGMLYLMGISSAGYLGGKLARQPGPVITTATKDTSGNYVLTGRNLEKNNVRLNETAIAPATITTSDPEDRTGFYKTLTFPATLPAATTTVTAIVTNADGQKAEKEVS